MPIERREFLRTVAVTTAAVGAGALAPSGCRGTGEAPAEEAERAARDASVLRIVDTHQHLWDLEKFSPPWLATAPEVLRQSYVTKDYLEATEGLDVACAVYMEVDVAPERQVDEARHVIGLAKDPDHPTLAAVISGRPGTPGFEEYITQFSDSPFVKGVRQVLQVPETKVGHCLGDSFVESMRLLGDLGLSFDLCMRPGELADGVELAKRVPQTRFIVDHCGNADPKSFRPAGREGGTPWHEKEQWKRDMAEFAELDNVVCKISGIIARVPQDWTTADLAVIVDYCLDHFGSERVVFGSDWPVCNITASYRAWVNSLREIISRRPRDEQRRLLSANAQRIYGLPAC